MNLLEPAARVLDTLDRDNFEMQDDDGNWYSIRVLPYRTSDNVIDGIVINFIDVTESKRIRTLAEDTMNYAESIVDAVREPLLVLDRDFRVVSANRSFFETFNTSGQEAEGSLLYELGNGQWNIPELRELLEKIVSGKSSVQDLRVELDLPFIGHRVVLNARCIEPRGTQSKRILLAMEETTKLN